MGAQPGGIFPLAPLTHELVFSGLSWPTLDKPFWLDVGNISLSLSCSTIKYPQTVVTSLAHYLAPVGCHSF